MLTLFKIRIGKVLKMYPPRRGIEPRSPRDRRGYLPLYYRGYDLTVIYSVIILFVTFVMILLSHNVHIHKKKKVSTQLKSKLS